jgi:hypothetical protein
VRRRVTNHLPKHSILACVIALSIVVGAPTAALAQDQSDDGVLRLAEPEFRLVNLPTTMLMPRYKLSFDLGHRFAGNLASGSFGDNAANLFGLDQGATVGLELRFAPIRGVQVAAYRTTFDRALQVHGRYDVIRQGDRMPLGIAALASIEGSDNMTENHAPALGGVVSWTVAERLAAYAVPLWVHNTAPLTGVTRDTFVFGLGGRFRVSGTVYVVGEVSPRVSGYAPGDPEYGFGIEKRVGGHLFQVNFTNTFAMTYAQVATGGFPDTLYLGFNLARKFF